MKYYIIYETTNLVNDKKYRGLHQTFNLEDGYLGSGVVFKNAVKKYGKENFKREILAFYNSFEELLEAEKIYVDLDWVALETTYNLKTGGQSAGILSDKSKEKISKTLKDKYKNGEIIIIQKSTEPLSEELKEKIKKGVTIIAQNKKEPVSEEMKDRISNTMTEYWKTHIHPSTGTIPWCKGKKMLKPNWNKGIKTGPLTEDHKQKISNTLKEIYIKQEHHSKGKEPWNKNTKGLQEAWNKGIIMKKQECPNCGGFFDLLNLHKWHLDKCRKHK